MADDRPPDEPEPLEPEPNENIFAGIPVLGDLTAMLGGMGGTPGSIDVWGNATQIAHQIATQIVTDNEPESNVDPLERVALEQLVRVAELHVEKVTGLDPTGHGSPTKLELVTRSQWALDAVTLCRPLMERIASRLGEVDIDADSSQLDGEHAEAMMQQMMKLLNPLMVSLCTGMMAGHLARYVFGDYGLLLARQSDTVHLVGTNISEFSEQWSLDINNVLLWVCIRQLALHAVFSVPHVGASITALRNSYADGFRYNLEVTRHLTIETSEQNLGSDGGDPNMAAINNQMGKLFSNPEVLLGAERTEAQAAITAQLEARLGLVCAYVDHVLQAAGHRLISDYDALAEALHRRRTTSTDADRFMSHLLGGVVDAEQAQVCTQFVAGVLARAGDEGLALLWADEANWPTPNEIVAPGLWLERIAITAAS